MPPGVDGHISSVSATATIGRSAGTPASHAGSARSTPSGRTFVTVEPATTPTASRSNPR
jgi:hypothetical protein